MAVAVHLNVVSVGSMVESLLKNMAALLEREMSILEYSVWCSMSPTASPFSRLNHCNSM
jgi:hypothetical protein